MNRRAIALVLLGLLPASAGAQAPMGSAALGRYLGTWVYEGDGNGGRVTCRSERRWIANDAFVESHRECSTPNGPITQVEIFGYNPRRNVYTYIGFNGRVPSTYSSPTMGRTVSWTGEEASAMARCSTVFADDGLSSTEQCEVTSDGTTWRRVSGGTSRKVQ